MLVALVYISLTFTIIKRLRLWTFFKVDLLPRSTVVLLLVTKLFRYATSCATEFHLHLLYLFKYTLINASNWRKSVILNEVKYLIVYHSYRYNKILRGNSG